MTKKEFYIDFDFTEVQNLNKENLAPRAGRNKLFRR